MADIKVEQKSGGQLTWLWAAAAVIAVVAFMFWLYNESAQVQPITAVEGDTAEVVEGAAGEAAEAAELAAIGQSPDAYVGRTVQVSAVPVAATLGPRAFWGEIPGANPLLVVLEPSVQGVEPAGGQAFDVRGTVQPVDEQLLTEWVQAGAINEAAREEASFATHALVVDQATPAQAVAPAPAQ